MSTFLILLLILIGLLYSYFKWSYNYWNRKNVINIPGDIPFGNLSSPFNPSYPIHVALGKIYKLLKSKNAKFGGFYFVQNPVFVPIDLDLIRLILSVDFNHFEDRGLYVVREDFPLDENLVALHGIKWKTLRSKLTPTFTSGKMKNMFTIMLECGNNMIRYVDEEILAKNKPFKAKETLSYFTTDVIGSAVFGLECNCFQDTDSVFFYHAELVLNGSIWDKLRCLLVYTWPRFANALGLSMFSTKVINFFMDIVQETVKYREQNHVVRNDFLQLLISMMNKNEDTLTFNELAAQCFIFFIAGYETSALTMTYVMYELAMNIDVQEKCRKEVLNVLEKYNGEMTYDGIMELKYIQQVIDETLRLHSPIPLLHRRVTKTYKVPNTDVILDEGTLLLIPTYVMHHDSDYFPEPYKFDPDRFSDENKDKIKRFSYLPFGDGPRYCIGLRFGLLQTKTGISMLLKNYYITMNSMTKVPLGIDPTSFTNAPKGDVLLNLRKIT